MIQQKELHHANLIKLTDSEKMVWLAANKCEDFFHPSNKNWLMVQDYSLACNSNFNLNILNDVVDYKKMIQTVFFYNSINYYKKDVGNNLTLFEKMIIILFVSDQYKNLHQKNIIHNIQYELNKIISLKLDQVKYIDTQIHILSYHMHNYDNYYKKHFYSKYPYIR